MIKHSVNKPIVEVDGGVNDKNAHKLVQAGANALVAGNFVFSSANPIETISNLKKISEA